MGHWARFVGVRRLVWVSTYSSFGRLQTLRSSGPDTEQRPAMLTVSVQEYDIADARPVFGKGAE
jgi:hypothetical protein